MTEALINYHQRAEALEQSARRLLNNGTNNALTPAEVDLLMATDAFMLAREDLALSLVEPEAVEPEAEALVAFSVEGPEQVSEREPAGFEVTP